MLGTRPRQFAGPSLLSLALAEGALDTTSYLGLGKVFTANMTGNTVRLLAARLRSQQQPIAGPGLPARHGSPMAPARSPAPSP